MTINKIKSDPLKIGFYCVEYENSFGKKSAVYFNLESAQSAMMFMIKRGIKCGKLYEWKPKPEIVLIQKK